MDHNINAFKHIITDNLNDVCSLVPYVNINVFALGMVRIYIENYDTQNFSHTIIVQITYTYHHQKIAIRLFRLSLTYRLPKPSVVKQSG